MPNWYKREKGIKPPPSRYIGTMTAEISVPSQENKEQEKDTAIFVLEKFLPETADASPRTAIDSTVNINITGVESYG